MDNSLSQCSPRKSASTYAGACASVLYYILHRTSHHAMLKWFTCSKFSTVLFTDWLAKHTPGQLCCPAKPHECELLQWVGPLDRLYYCNWPANPFRASTCALAVRTLVPSAITMLAFLQRLLAQWQSMLHFEEKKEKVSKTNLIIFRALSGILKLRCTLTISSTHTISHIHANMV